MMDNAESLFVSGASFPKRHQPDLGGEFKVGVAVN